MRVRRKLTPTIGASGTKWKIVADRQELRVYLRAGAGFEAYAPGWTIRYITDLQEPVAFYLRGEEYSAQIESFMHAVRDGRADHATSFASASETDRVIDQVAKAGQAGR